jgi:integrase
MLDGAGTSARLESPSDDASCEHRASVDEARLAVDEMRSRGGSSMTAPDSGDEAGARGVTDRLGRLRIRPGHEPRAPGRSLRVHDAPLCFGVLPPKGGPARKRPWLYPSEWEQLAKCEAVTLEWRRTFCIAAYVGLRPNELKALLWGDVDLDALVIRALTASTSPRRSR